MKNETYNAKQAVAELINKAKETHDATDALKFSQAACNVAHARAAMFTQPLPSEKEES